MSSNQNPSADAVLLAILGFLVERAICDPSPSQDESMPDVLSPDGLAIVRQMVAEANRVEAQIFTLKHGASLDDAVFRDYRVAIDRLWTYVKDYGLDALAQEADRRIEMGEPAYAS